MKKRLVFILLTIVTTITLGYLFFLSLLLGFLGSKYMAGKSVGERGKLRSIVIPLRKWGIHLHHWLYSLCLVSLSFTTGMHFLTPTITYGLLGGLVFQGIYCYNDWHIILISRHKTRTRERLVNTSEKMVERVLLVVNRLSATGHTGATVDRLRSTLEEALGHETELQVEVVDDHPAAREQTKAFLAISDAPALVIAGGGSGTLRAVIEGVCAGSEPGHLPGRERVRIAALRMGSGNPVAKQFGVPHAPETALKGIVANLCQDRTVPCCVMRCEVSKAGSHPDIHYAATMSGFGQFGRSPGDLVRWHHRLPVLRKLMARLLGIERLNNIEYSLSLFIRFAWCALWPNAVEVVEVRTGERIQSMPLLAGVVMNFPFKPLPFEPEVHVEDAALSLNFISYPGRWASLFLMLSPRRLTGNTLQIRIADADRVEVRLANRDAIEFFLDEDPLVFHSSVLIQVAGTLAFVPGQDYQWPPVRGGNS